MIDLTYNKRFIVNPQAFSLTVCLRTVPVRISVLSLYVAPYLSLFLPLCSSLKPSL